jgi:hypothetical protein
MTWCSRVKVGFIIQQLSSPLLKYQKESTLRAQMGANRTLATQRETEILTAVFKIALV